MADQKISSLAALTGLNVDDLDELVIVDKSDTTMAGTGTDKRIVFSELVVAFSKRDLGLDQWGAAAGFLP